MRRLKTEPDPGRRLDRVEAIRHLFDLGLGLMTAAAIFAVLWPLGRRKPLRRLERLIDRRPHQIDVANIALLEFTRLVRTLSWFRRCSCRTLMKFPLPYALATWQ